MIKSKKYFFIIGLLIFVVINLAISQGFSKKSPNYFCNFQNNKLQEQIKFIHVSDIHLELKPKTNHKSPRLLQHSKELLNSLITDINKTKNVDFILFSGDIINTPTSSNLEYFAKTASKLKYPWFVAAGNHDLSVGGSLNRKKFFEIINRYNKTKHNNSYYCHNIKNKFMIIAMDGVINNRITANGYFSKAQLSFLKTTIHKNPNKKIIIFQHFPLIEPFKSKSHKTINADEYIKIINNSKNVLTVLSGHYHSSKIIKQNNIIHVSTPALVEYPNAYRIVSIKADKNKTYLDFKFKQTSLKQYINLSKNRSKSYKLKYAEPKDRNSKIIIDN